MMKKIFEALHKINKHFFGFGVRKKNKTSWNTKMSEAEPSEFGKVAQGKFKCDGALLAR